MPHNLFDGEARGDSVEEEDLPESGEYILDERDHHIVEVAETLLWKVLRTARVSPAETLAASRAMFALSILPRVGTPIEVSVGVTGLRRQYEDREIRHWWDIGGHFYCPSTGGDSFTCFTWAAFPGTLSSYSNYEASLGIVDDVTDFETEVETIDLSDEEYGLETSDFDNEFFNDDTADDDDDETESDDK